MATDPSDDETVQSSCDEAIAELWLRHGRFEQEVLARLTPAAHHEAVGLVRVRRPEWLEPGVQPE